MPKTARVVPVAIYDKQADILTSKAQIRGFTGGRGCGKSKTGAIDLLNRAKQGRFYMGTAPTYPMLADATIRSFIETAQQTGQMLPGDYNKSNHLARFKTQDGGYAELRFRSTDNPDSLRGPNLSGLWMDEASVSSKEAFEIAIGCCREAGELGWVMLTFTPKGKRHWTFETFYDEHKRIKPHVQLVKAHSRENPFNAPEFVDLLTRQYSSRLAEQEIAGEFVDLEGLLFQRDWFEVIDQDRVPRDGLNYVRYWDKAATHGSGCYTAGVLMAADRQGYFYVLHVIRGQWSPDERNKVMKTTAKVDAMRFGNVVRQIVEQEPGAGGVESALLTVRLLAGYPVTIDRVSGVGVRMQAHERLPNQGKIVRAQPMAAQAEHGYVKLANGPWVSDLLDELCAFPEFRFMDQVDACSGAFNHLSIGTIPGPIHTPSAVTHSKVETKKRGIQVASRPQGEGPGRYGIRLDRRQ